MSRLVGDVLALADRAGVELTGPLNWYRAVPLEPLRARPVPVPTLLVHGGRDRFITSAAAELSRRRNRPR